MVQSGLVPVDARALLGHVLGVNRAWLLAHDRDAISHEAATQFFALAKRRRDGEPIAYLVGRREFWGLDLGVTRAVLIPRPETETLVEAALARIPQDQDTRVLDLGTGSGAIALAIAKERSRARVFATDISPEALDVARSNASRLRIDNVTFIESDWYVDVPIDPLDIIASNPPYIAPDDPRLEQGDLRFEPRVAQTPGPDGLSAIKVVIFGALSRLKPGGWLLIEHGYDQSAIVTKLFAGGGFEAIVRLRDLAGIHRVVAGRRPT
ncbi:MAG TPA: peptide chain release factor N(5)-glutamine methyltransferase [Casimicrobiaceae bacterium]|nr:peptide chain release factor N(5)-glutamine methyltransferase [Casimicrobiaceae bacterium]